MTKTVAQKALFTVGYIDIRHDGKVFPIGSTIELTAEEANLLAPFLTFKEPPQKTAPTQKTEQPTKGSK